MTWVAGLGIAMEVKIQHDARRGSASLRVHDAARVSAAIRVQLFQ